MPYDVRFHWQAEAAINSLPPDQRQRVLAALQQLQAGGFRAMPDVRRVADEGGTEELYVLRAGNALRVMFTIEPGNVISVQDVINRQFAQRYG